MRPEIRGHLVRFSCYPCRKCRDFPRFPQRPQALGSYLCARCQWKYGDHVRLAGESNKGHLGFYDCSLLYNIQNLWLPHEESALGSMMFPWISKSLAKLFLCQDQITAQFDQIGTSMSTGGASIATSDDFVLLQNMLQLS